MQYLKNKALAKIATGGGKSWYPIMLRDAHGTDRQKFRTISREALNKKGLNQTLGTLKLPPKKDDNI